MGEGEKVDHDAAGLPVWQALQQRVERAPERLAREKLVAIDQVQQRHRLLAQGMDDMAVIDDMGVLAGAWAARATGS